MITKTDLKSAGLKTKKDMKTNVHLKFPSQFSKHINHVKQVEFDGETFLDLINFLDVHFGKIKERLIDEDSKTIKPYLNVFVNKKSLAVLNGLNTKISEGASVSLLLSRAGG